MLNNKKVLLFHVAAEKEKQIHTLCKSMQIQIIVIKKELYDNTLGALAGITGMKLSGKKYTGEEFPTDMMIFSGIPSDELDMFLKKYREAMIVPIPLKAVLTPTNINWKAGDLYQELLREHLSFQK
jgi:hypothetical protein